MKRFINVILVLVTVVSLCAAIASLYLNSVQQKNNQDKITSLEAQIAQQKADKDEIRILWEEQAANSDKLIIAQDNLNTQITNYQDEIKKSIRFVNSSPQLLSTISEKNLTAAGAQITAAQQNLETITQENSTAKQNAKATIDGLYLKAGEQQNNRANPRTGAS